MNVSGILLDQPLNQTVSNIGIYISAVNVRHRGLACVNQSSNTITTSNDARDIFSLGDYIRVGNEGFRVTTPFDAITLTLDRPYTGATSCDINVWAFKQYTPLRGSVLVVNGSVNVQTKYDMMATVSRGDVLKIGRDNFFVAPTGPFNSVNVRYLAICAANQHPLF
jgi:hypothetical protein